MAEDFHRQLSGLDRRLSELVKEKEFKSEALRAHNRLHELITDTEATLTLKMSELETTLARQIGMKGALKDLAVLETSKADVSALQHIQEKVRRMEQIIEERLGESNDSYSQEDSQSHQLHEEVNGSEEEEEFKSVKSFQEGQTELEGVKAPIQHMNTIVIGSLENDQNAIEHKRSTSKFEKNSNRSKNAKKIEEEQK